MALLDIRTILLLALAVVSVLFILVWRSAARKALAARTPDEQPQAIYHSLVSFVMCMDPA